MDSCNLFLGLASTLRSNDRFGEFLVAASGRLHSVTKGRFWEAKPQRQLYGDEFGTRYFASRPRLCENSSAVYSK